MKSSTNVANFITLQFILILQTDCDSLVCGNYRIITPINSEHKIFAMALAKLFRNKKSTHYISTSQVVIVKNRFRKCLNTVCNIIHLANKWNSPAADDLIEAEKAFHWIEWDYSVPTQNLFVFSVPFTKLVSQLCSYFLTCKGPLPGCLQNPSTRLSLILL